MTHERNRGKGAAVQTGVAAAQGEIVWFTDANGSIPILELSKLLSALESGADVAIGSRYLPGSAMNAPPPWYRVLWSRITNWVIRKTLIKSIQDTQCGFKAFKSRVAKSIFPKLTVNGWGFDLELLALLNIKGYKIAEIPVAFQDDPRSRALLFHDAWNVICDYISIQSNLIRKLYSVN